MDSSNNYNDTYLGMVSMTMINDSTLAYARFPELKDAEALKHRDPERALEKLLPLRKKEKYSVYVHHQCLICYRNMKVYDKEIPIINEIFEIIENVKLEDVYSETEFNNIKGSKFLYDRRIAYCKRLLENQAKRKKNKTNTFQQQQEKNQNIETTIEIQQPLYNTEPTIKKIELTAKKMGEQMSFNAVDFETATFKRSSICEIGITEVVEGKVIASHNWLVKPQNNEYHSRNISIHGITPEMTKDKPTFKELWESIKPYFDNKIIVAHNTSFDMYALRDVLDYYGIEYPYFRNYCSLRLARIVICGLPNYTLPTVYEAVVGEKLEVHHRGESDSDACAKIFIACMKRLSCKISELEGKLNFSCGIFAPGMFRAQHNGQRYERETFPIIQTEINKAHISRNVDANDKFGTTHSYKNELSTAQNRKRENLERENNGNKRIKIYIALVLIALLFYAIILAICLFNINNSGY